MLSKNKMLIICLIVPLTAQAQYPPPPPRAFVIHGLTRTCDTIGNLDRALANNDYRYFGGWSYEDYETAIQWAGLCVLNGQQQFAPPRVAKLRAYESKVFPSPEEVAAAQAARQQADDERARRDAQAAQNQARIDDERARIDAERRARIAEAQKREAQRVARANALAACRRGDQYRIFQAQQRLRADIDAKESNELALAHEHKVEAVSGVQDMNREYALGQQSVYVDEALDRDWAAYQLAGGKSKKNSGLQLIDNPCIGTSPDE